MDRPGDQRAVSLLKKSLDGLLERGLCHRHDFDNTRVSHDDIQTAVGTTYLLKDRIEIGRLRDVAANAGDVASDFGNRLVELLSLST